MLEDYTTAPIDEKLRAALRLLEKMTLHPDALTAEDVRAALDRGLSRAAVRDAMEVCYLFNLFDRLADSMGWDVPAETSGSYEVGARMLLRRGYR